uniref:Uncharacterized protein n=1 Tax=Arundo donax TaxID=35708 RepID=A0A0A9A8T9_ARUDO
MCTCSNLRPCGLHLQFISYLYCFYFRLSYIVFFYSLAAKI